MTCPEAWGALLAGGSSRRMGRPKADIELGGRSLARRADHTLAQCTTEVVQLGGEPIAGLQRRHLPDARQGAGPAAGVEAALAACGIHVVVLAVDLPFVPPSLLSAALRVVDEGAAACAPKWEGRWHPLCAAYSQAALSPLRLRLDEGIFDLHGLLDEIATPLSTDELREHGEPAEVLLNINTPEDLSFAEKRLSAADDENRQRTASRPE